MKPDEELLALWVEDELEATTHAEVEAWASRQPEWLARRQLARASKELLQTHLSADEEVPNAEFFNARIRREIQIASSGGTSTESSPPARRPVFGWLVPLTAAASLAIGFWIGSGRTTDIEPISPPVAELAPVLYTPEQGVEAEVLNNEDATVIVLAGVDAIPDSWELPATAMYEPVMRPIAASF